MPMERARYPANWEKIATDKKNEVGWKCEVCGGGLLKGNKDEIRSKSRNK